MKTGQHHYGVNVGDDRLAVNYDFSQWKHGVDVSKTETTFGETKTVLRDVKKQSAGISYAITDHLDFLYQYLNTEATYNRLVTESSAAAPVGALFNGRKYTTDRHITQLNYKDKLWKASLYFNSGTVESEGPTNYTSSGRRSSASSNHYNTREKNITYGLDAQRRWKLAGADTTAHPSAICSITRTNSDHIGWQETCDAGTRESFEHLVGDRARPRRRSVTAAGIFRA